MRRTFIPLLQRKASAFSCQVLREDFGSSVKQYIPYYSADTLIAASLSHDAIISNARCCMSVPTSQCVGQLHEQKLRNLLSWFVCFFVGMCCLILWISPLGKFAYAASICGKHFAKTSVPLGKLDPGCWHSQSFFNVLQATFSEHLIYQTLNSLVIDMHSLSAHVYVLERDLTLFLTPFFGGKVHAACLSLSPG